MLGRVAVAYRDGSRELAVIGRPADLIALEDHSGRSEPETYSDLAFLVYRALRPGEPFAEWVERVDDLDGRDRVVERTRRLIDGELPQETAFETLERAFAHENGDTPASEEGEAPTPDSGGEPSPA